MRIYINIKKRHFLARPFHIAQNTRRVLVFIPLVQDLWTTERREVFRPEVGGNRSGLASYHANFPS